MFFVVRARNGGVHRQGERRDGGVHRGSSSAWNVGIESGCRTYDTTGTGGDLNGRYIGFGEVRKWWRTWRWGAMGGCWNG